MKKSLLFLLILLPGYSLLSQTTQPRFGIQFTGFVRTDVFYDTRENVSLREGHFLLFPENEMKDLSGKDINKQLNFNILSINSRLKGMITGPDALGAKTSGMMEAEFFGMSESDVNGFRLRHAFLKMQWPKTELLVGQFWHPMFHTECFPLTISFSTGAPFQPFNRSPQLRVVQHAGSTDWMLAAVSQRDFTSYGPNPSNPSQVVNSSVFLRNAGLPEFQFRMQWNIDTGKKYFVGFGLGTKAVKPELYTLDTGDRKVASTTQLRSYSAYVFGKVSCNHLLIRMQGILAQNAADLTMLGGYALKEITDTITGAREYSPVTTASAWMDVTWTAGAWKPGLFLAYSSNLGSSEVLTHPVFYSRGSNIEYLYRVAPRVTYTTGKLDLSLEAEVTTAAYGTIKEKARLSDSREVTNIRPLLVVSYSF